MELLLVGDGGALDPRQKGEMTDRPFAKQGSLCLRRRASIRTRERPSASPLTVARQSRIHTGVPPQSAPAPNSPRVPPPVGGTKVVGGSADRRRGGRMPARLPATTE